MIKPNPESDLSLNILVIGSEIVDFLKRQDSFTVLEDMLLDILCKDHRRTPALFVDALTFLYTVGLIEQKGYKIKLLKKNDYTQPNLL